MDVASLADLLHETAERHDPYEKSAPEHNWWDWYAAYLNARLEGSSQEEASQAAGVYMEGVLGDR
jgi:hypothetical protein